MAGKNKLQNYLYASMLRQEGVGARQVLEARKAKKLPKVGESEIEQWMDELEQKRIGVLPSWSRKFPKLLKHTKDYPAVLFWKGNVGLLDKKLITIVGTRSISVYGKYVVQEFLNSCAEYLGEFAVVSGMAYGVDSAVHRACLESGIDTIGVVAGPIDQGFPRGNWGLYKQMSAHGLILGEFPPGRQLFKGMFPMRNRIMSGLSEITFVVEAPLKSGSLITSRYALDYGREVVTVPGNINNFRNQGNNSLIFDGCSFVNNRWEWLAKIGALSRGDLEEKLLATDLRSIKKQLAENELEIKIRGFEFPISDIMDKVKISEFELMEKLTKLEMKGILCQKLPGIISICE